MQEDQDAWNQMEKSSHQQLCNQGDYESNIHKLQKANKEVISKVEEGCQGCKTEKFSKELKKSLNSD